MRKVYLLIVGTIASALVVSFLVLQGFVLRDWRTIATFSGAEGLEIRTDPFLVPSSTWRIYYNMTRNGLGEFTHLGVAIYRADVDKSDPESYFGGFSRTPSALQIGESSGYVYDIDPRWNPGGSGEFYLEVSAIDCNWTITVEAYS